VEGSEDLRDLMEIRGVKKIPGCSFVEIYGFLREFSAGEMILIKKHNIHKNDESLKRLEKNGYVCNTNDVLLDLDEKGKEFALSHYSKKLALAYCLLRIKPGTTILSCCYENGI
jgi:magnesium/proton exchanger